MLTDMKVNDIKRSNTVIPITQKILNFENGDCFSACVASILELPLTCVPNFNIPSQDSFVHNLEKWCKKQTFILLDITIDDVALLSDCIVIANGSSPRATENWHRHSVVWQAGKMLHDPHPGGFGIDGDPETYTIFIVKNKIATSGNLKGGEIE